MRHCTPIFMELSSLRKKVEPKRLRGTFWKTLPFWMVDPFFPSIFHLGKWPQNSATGGGELWTIKWIHVRIYAEGQNGHHLKKIVPLAKVEPFCQKKRLKTVFFSNMIIKEDTLKQHHEHFTNQKIHFLCEAAKCPYKVSDEREDLHSNNFLV